ncbi:histone-like nucleoid-structuring protein, MvaT/MvaU family [Pseudomonas panipatensis]|uniref:H-NS histone family protein n=1 Tax=Pseudomonas panipatensis TaxID=428992 RepID=A0A1G8G4C5_9PSED|nr:histone-like nucleoid-structuring protein, MvaT/MvaU family [Pseudomonas panipatensis]SDH89293.1 H-NS histone family protein [Pseudomonas panipatensis]SMP45446.1 H-NS histone family protein [Pseudomonas panipatensis]
MSKLAEFKALEAQLAEQLRRLDALKNDDRLKKEIEFERKLRVLMAEYGMDLGNIKTQLAPLATPSNSAAKEGQGQRRERKMKVYLNPHTDETVETRGGNHKQLKAWKEEHGAAEVESWLQG